MYHYIKSLKEMNHASSQHTFHGIRTKLLYVLKQHIYLSGLAIIFFLFSTFLQTIKAVTFLLSYLCKVEMMLVFDRMMLIGNTPSFSFLEFSDCLNLKVLL